MNKPVAIGFILKEAETSYYCTMQLITVKALYKYSLSIVEKQPSSMCSVLLVRTHLSRSILNHLRLSIYIALLLSLSTTPFTYSFGT